MRVVTRRAFNASGGTGITLPVAAGAPVDASLPIPICWTMAACAKFDTFVPLILSSVPCLECVEVLRIVAIKALIIAIIAPVTHDEVLVLFWQNWVAGRVQPHLDWFVSFMAGIAV